MSTQGTKNAGNNDPGHNDLGRAWSETIIDHSQFPRRHGELEHATHEGQGENPFCGDRIRLQLRIDDAGLITDARFQATGCAISMASASMLISRLGGLKLAEAEALFRSVHDLLTRDAQTTDAGFGELLALQLVKQYPARVKCASLAWHVLHHALAGDEAVASTE